MHHIRNTLPEIKAKIQAALAKYLAELATLGDGMSEGAGQANIVLNIITEFCTEFRTIIDGNSTDLTSFELSGGARISFVFHELYSNGVKALDPFDQVKDVDIRTILYNSSVSRGFDDLENVGIPAKSVTLTSNYVCYHTALNVGFLSCTVCRHYCLRGHY